MLTTIFNKKNCIQCAALFLSDCYPILAHSPYCGTKSWLYQTFFICNYIVLDKNISVSQCRKQSFSKKIGKKNYKIYPVYYPIGNGMMNIDKAIEDLKFIIETNT